MEYVVCILCAQRNVLCFTSDYIALSMSAFGTSVPLHSRNDLTSTLPKNTKNGYLWLYLFSVH